MSAANPLIPAGAGEERFLVAFFRLVQAVSLYDDNNELVKRSLKQLQEIASVVLSDSELAIVFLEGGYYVPGRKFRHNRRIARFLREFLETFSEKGLNGFLFPPEFRQASPRAILSFFRCVVQALDRKNPFDWLNRQVEEQHLTWMELIDAEKARELINNPLFAAERAQEAYQRSVSTIKEVNRRSRSGMWKAKRVVQSMVDLVQEDDAIFVGLSTIRDYDDYTYVHSVNVSVLSICVGNRIGLSKQDLTLLGICGLLHDMGKIEIDPMIIKKPGKLDDAEFREIQKHPLSSMRLILKSNTSHSLKSQIFLAPLEHHLNYDLSGYPKIGSKEKVSLFGRILKLADVYDAITSPRAYRKLYNSPDQALRLMMQKSGTEFDPILLKVFVRMLGKYPMGTLLVLDSQEIGLVVGHSESEPEKLPKVMLLGKGEDGRFIRGEVIDLGEQDPQTGAMKRKVLRSYHPAVCGIQPAEFLINYE